MINFYYAWVFQEIANEDVGDEWVFVGEREFNGSEKYQTNKNFSHVQFHLIK